MLTVTQVKKTLKIANAIFFMKILMTKSKVLPKPLSMQKWFML